MAAFGDQRLPLRFWAKVRRSTNGCWRWTSRVDAQGYGQFSVSHRDTQRAYRWAYHVLVAPLTAKRGEPGHLQVDHECHNRSKSCAGGPGCLHRRCVNPAHLRAVVAKTNVLAGKGRAAVFAKATHCLNGHEFTAANTYRDQDGHRSCRRCRIDQSRENRRVKARARGPIPHYQSFKTHCPRGHLYSGENLYVAPDGSRKCKACCVRRNVEYQERKCGGPRPGHRRDWTHCIRGHELGGENLYVVPGSGKRQCRTCRRAHSRS